MFDNTCKFLAETFPSDFATWLLGEAILLTKLEPTELSLKPIRADSVIFLESSQIENISDRTLQSNVAAATAIISGLVLEQKTIQRLLRSEMMKESLIYQEVLREGKIEGNIEGKIEERFAIAKKIVKSGLTEDLIMQLTGLSLEEIR